MERDTPVGAIVGVPPEFDPSPLQRARSVVIPDVSVADEQSVQSATKKTSWHGIDMPKQIVTKDSIDQLLAILNNWQGDLTWELYCERIQQA